MYDLRQVLPGYSGPTGRRGTAGCNRVAVHPDATQFIELRACGPTCGPNLINSGELGPLKLLIRGFNGAA
jgi:hypothetical protein